MAGKGNLEIQPVVMEKIRHFEFSSFRYKTASAFWDPDSVRALDKREYLMNIWDNFC